MWFRKLGYYLTLKKVEHIKPSTILIWPSWEEADVFSIVSTAWGANCSTPFRHLVWPTWTSTYPPEENRPFRHRCTKHVVHNLMY